MKKTALFLPLLIASSGWLPAQSAEDLQLERRSESDISPAQRNPFWPVGWAKKEVNAAAPSGAVENVIDTSFLVPSRFAVSSISIGKFPLAVINGKTYGEGDLIAVNNGANRVNVQVVSIRDGKVKLRYADKTIETSIKAESKSTR